MVCGDFESARQLGWVMVLTLEETLSMPSGVRRQKTEALRGILAFDFPPVYQEDSSETQPFWQKSLSVGATLQMHEVHTAFEMPAASKPK